MLVKAHLFLLATLSFSAVAVLGAPTDDSKEKIKRTQGKGEHLIQLDKSLKAVWMTDEQELDLIKSDTHFVRPCRSTTSIK